MKILKFLAFAVVVLSFMMVGLIFFPLLSVSKSYIRKQLIHLVSFVSKLMLKILRIEVQCHVSPQFSKEANYLVVANHLSYLDVIILASQMPTCFVTSREVKDTFFLGHLTQLAGCLFVDRKNKMGLKGEISELRQALMDGLSVTVFPEATSTNGEEILRFRRPLFEASVATQKSILPITLNYRSISGEKFNRSNRDVVCWYGEMTFFDHFLKVLEQDKIKVEVHVSEPFAPAIMSSFDLASKSQEIIKLNYSGFSQNVMEAL